MVQGNQGTHTALSCHCPHVHCLLPKLVCLFPYTVGQQAILSFQQDFLSFCLFCIHSQLAQIRKVFNLLQIFEVLFSSEKLEGLFSIKANVMVFSQGSLMVWGASGTPCIFWNFLIFWQSCIGGTRAFWLGTYLTECVFTKLKFCSSFYIITFKATTSTLLGFAAHGWQIETILPWNLAFGAVEITCHQDIYEKKFWTWWKQNLYKIILLWSSQTPVFPQ